LSDQGMKENLLTACLGLSKEILISPMCWIGLIVAS
jgi:hypothetical protein